MKLASLVGLLLRDHYRRGAVLVEGLVAGLTLALFLDPRHLPYEPSYVATVLAFTACALPVLNASIIAARAGGLRSELFILAGGRGPYFLSVAAAAWFSSLAWLGLMLAVVVLFGLSSPPANWLGSVVALVAANAALSAAIFCTFSTMVGSQLNWAFGMILLIMGLNRSWFADLGRPWLRRLAWLVPPLMENVRGAAGTGPPEILLTGIYLVCVLAFGVWRFRRREFYWS